MTLSWNPLTRHPGSWSSRTRSACPSPAACTYATKPPHNAKDMHTIPQHLASRDGAISCDRAPKGKVPHTHPPTHPSAIHSQEVHCHDAQPCQGVHPALQSSERWGPRIQCCDPGATGRGGARGSGPSTRQPFLQNQRPQQTGSSHMQPGCTKVLGWRQTAMRRLGADTAHAVTRTG